MKRLSCVFATGPYVVATNEQWIITLWAMSGILLWNPVTSVAISTFSAHTSSNIDLLQKKKTQWKKKQNFYVDIYEKDPWNRSLRNFSFQQFHRQLLVSSNVYTAHQTHLDNSSSGTVFAMGGSFRAAPLSGRTSSSDEAPSISESSSFTCSSWIRWQNNKQHIKTAACSWERELRSQFALKSQCSSAHKHFLTTWLLKNTEVVCIGDCTAINPYRRCATSKVLFWTLLVRKIVLIKATHSSLTTRNCVKI